jgi:hypothetical protein
LPNADGILLPQHLGGQLTIGCTPCPVMIEMDVTLFPEDVPDVIPPELVKAKALYRKGEKNIKKVAELYDKVVALTTPFLDIYFDPEGLENLEALSGDYTEFCIHGLHEKYSPVNMKLGISFGECDLPEIRMKSRFILYSEGPFNQRRYDMWESDLFTDIMCGPDDFVLQGLVIKWDLPSEPDSSVDVWNWEPIFEEKEFDSKFNWDSIFAGNDDEEDED